MKRFIGLICAVLLVAGCMPWDVITADAAGTEGGEVSIVFTHDMHSHMDTGEITENGKVAERGGFAKIMTVKDQIEEEYPGTFLFDAGDFSMGTAYQTLFAEEAPEIVTMGKMGYDGTTLGNHEFDYGAGKLADMLNTAVEKADDRSELPVITGLNIDWDKTLKDEKTKKEGKKLYDAFQNYGVADYSIVEKNGVRIAFFGIIGDEAISNAPEAGVYFTDYITRAQNIVDEIEKNGEADMIVCLSHGGTGDSPEEYDDSDDVRLAKEVSGIDLIVSGHSHSEYDEPKKVGDSILVSSGEYTRNAGHVVLEKKENGEFDVKEYSLVPLDSSVENDSEIQSIVDGYQSDIDRAYFNDYGYSYNQVLAENNIAFTPIKKFATEQKEDTLGNLITDSYIYAVNQAEKGKNTDPVDVAIIPAGTVRASLNKGDVTVSDIFEISSLGDGPDGKPGYPVVSIYLTGKELKNAAEVDASVSPMMQVARLYMSGLGYTINDKRLILNRATDIALINRQGEEIEELDNDKLYRVVGGIYSCQMLSLVEEQSFGLLSVQPKDKDGNVITDFNKHIVRNSDGSELKEWYALASYIDSFDGEIPQYYASEHNRKVMDSSLNPVKLFKSPNHIAVMAAALFMIPVVIIAGIVVAFIRNRNRRRGFSKSMFSGGRRGRSYAGGYGGRRRRSAVKRRSFSVRNKRR